MSPTVEDAVAKLKANEIEDAQQILIKILNEDPKNDLAWKYLIEILFRSRFSNRIV